MRRNRKISISNMADAKVLTEVKDTVKYKKVDGTLRLVKNKISWIHKEESTPKIDIFYSDIKGSRTTSIALLLSLSA